MGATIDSAIANGRVAEQTNSMPLEDEIQDIARGDVGALRRTMAKLGATVAEANCDLQYVWIDNPHPDFDASSVVGKRDDELIPPAEAVEIVGLKRTILQQRRSVSRVLAFRRSDGWRHYSFRGFPVCNTKGKIEGIITIAFETELPAGAKRGR